MKTMYITAYIIKILFSTGAVYLLIRAANPLTYRNTLTNAFTAAVIFSFAGAFPFVFLAAMVIWGFALVNWYGVGRGRAVLCAAVYAFLFFVLNVFIAAALFGSNFVYSEAIDISALARGTEPFRKSIYLYMRSLPEPVREKLGIAPEPENETRPDPFSNDVKIFFKNGRNVYGRILMEGEKGYLVDIANGKSEVVIRKDDVERLKYLRKKTSIKGEENAREKADNN
ncbi:MAG: hypothetical protein ABH883_02540 [Candidatus Omnitrophota bacterium]